MILLHLLDEAFDHVLCTTITIVNGFLHDIKHAFQKELIVSQYLLHHFHAGHIST